MKQSPITPSQAIPPDRWLYEAYMQGLHDHLSSAVSGFLGLLNNEHGLFALLEGEDEEIEAPESLVTAVDAWEGPPAAVAPPWASQVSEAVAAGVAAALDHISPDATKAARAKGIKAATEAAFEAMKQPAAQAKDDARRAHERKP